MLHGVETHKLTDMQYASKPALTPTSLKHRVVLINTTTK